jgi:hypothetical protein
MNYVIVSDSGAMLSNTIEHSGARPTDLKLETTFGGNAGSCLKPGAAV